MATSENDKAAARREREAAAATAAQQNLRVRRFSGLVILAIVLVVVVVAIASGGSGGGLQTGKKLKQTEAAVNTLLAGIPQEGTTLGSPTAPVTMTYYGDLECPICADFTKHGGFSEFVAKQVKTGHVKIVYRSLCTATCGGPGQGTFDSQQAAAYSAGLQQKFWNYCELFYRQQGAEGSHYAKDKYLTTLAKQAGLDTQTWRAGLTNTKVVGQVKSDQALAKQKGYSQTPTLIFSGPNGSTHASESGGSDVFSYSALQKAQDKVA